MKAILHFILLTLLTGGVYPLAVTGIGQLFFPEQTGGSLVEKNGRIIGSRLLAQKFTQPGYFHPRPSSADYATLPSGASNLGPTSAKLNPPAVRQREERDAVSASGSGLDPHISPQAALAQVPRIARTRRIPPERLIALINEHTERSFFGPPRLNVLRLNLSLRDL